MSQTEKVSFKAFLPMVVIFAVVSLLAIFFKEQLLTRNFDLSLLHSGNVLLFTVTAISWIFHSKAINAGNTQAFLRNAYSALMLKLFACAISFFVYAIAMDGKVNKPALFSLMLLYLVYTFVELNILMRHSKRNSNNA